MILTKYGNYLTKLFFKNLLIITIVFLFLSFFFKYFWRIKIFRE